MSARNHGHHARSDFSLHPLGCYGAQLGRKMDAAHFLLHLKDSTKN